MPSTQIDLLSTLEQVLAQHSVFGDSRYIMGQLQACMKLRLGRIATRLPIAEELTGLLSELSAESAGRLVGESVLRCAIIHAHMQVETGQSYGLPLSECERVFEATVQHLRRGNSVTPLDEGSLRRLGDESYHGWIWSEDYPGSTFGRSFRHLVELNFGGLPCAPTRDEVAKLENGARLLRELLPSLAPSALGHAHVTACVSSDSAWKGKASSSQFNIGGTIFLSRSLNSPWWVAEHLFHEALHQKLYDLRHGHLLLELDFAKDGSPTVWSPWNQKRLNDANQWDAQRVLAAFHVYVHLALLGLIVEHRAPALEDTYGPVRGITSIGRAMERAHYLGEQLREVCWGQLGLAGQRLVEWLTSVLNILYVDRPPTGAYVHLCLDLYKKEATQVAASLTQGGASAAVLEEGLPSLVEAEVAATRHLLIASEVEGACESFDAALSNFRADELAKNFSEVRKLVASSISNVCPDGYRLSTPQCDKAAKQMLEDASEALYCLQQGYGPAVTHAKRRAHEMGFTSSCDDSVGRLLAMLAATVRPSGRILEIGTGVGVGVAWISEGLRGRTDVEVVSVEIDAALSKCAQEWSWPANTTIMTVDGASQFETLGVFDLVFADAAPVKYGNPDAVVRALSAGGILVIDDLETNENTSALHMEEKQALHRCLVRHSELRVLDLDWASGVILASKGFAT